MTSPAIIVSDVEPTPAELRPVPLFWRSYATLYSASWTIAVVGSVIAALVSAGPDGRGHWQATSLALILTVGGAYLAGQIWLRYARRFEQRLPSQRQPFTWTIDNGGLALDNAMFSQSIRWPAVVHTAEEPDRLIFAVSPNQNFILPKRCLSVPQLDEIRVLLQTLREQGHFVGFA